jgi:RHS repeat-associated protein
LHVYAVGSALAQSYDALGRVCSSAETVGSFSPGSFSCQYNLASRILTETYPSTRTISTSYDALNRPVGVGGVLSGTSTPYVNNSETSYASNDALAQLQFGLAGSALATQTFSYDPVRQQPTNVSVTSGASGSQLLHLGYGYCSPGVTSCSTNNGNVQSATITAPSASALTQSFGYDTLNRLMSAGETGGSSEWTQSYSYDAWGNRAVSGYIPNSYATPTALAQYTNNQWLGTGASYDLDGNLSTLPSRSFTYDAENRMTQSTQPGMGGISYIYDGNGRRVQKTVGSTVTTYVYDGGGQLTAEYGPGTASGTEYLLGDALGSTRLVLNASGGVQERLDYLPFGEELTVGIGGRAAPYSGGMYPSGPDVESQKFTGKERDAETGLDWFESRYYSSPLGRFASPDEFKGGFLDALTGRAAFQLGPLPYADISDPQTLNKYSYVRNSPLRYTDPDGHDAQQTLSPDEVKSVASDINAVSKFAEDHPVLTNLLLNGAIILMTRGEGAPGARIEPAEGAGGGAVEAPTMRAGQREAMRQQDIPTSQQPTAQTNTPAGRQYEYEVPKPGGGTTTKVVQRNNGTDSSHPGEQHVEAGSPKPQGQTDSIGRPRLDSSKTKVTVKKSEQ